MKKLLLLLPMLATVSMYGMDPHDAVFQAALRWMGGRSTQSGAHSHSATVRITQQQPYQLETHNHRPRTMYDVILAANPNTTFVHYETGEVIKREDLPGHK